MKVLFRFSLCFFFFYLGISHYLCAKSVRERIIFDENWLFAFGDASSPINDFGCGTEYFNYLTKASSIHNVGPYSLKFDSIKWDKKWKNINLPHDWVVDLPFDSQASHSHGYKTVGYRYPKNSVGWYRKFFTLSESDKNKHIWLQFDGIFRDARVWINGFYIGHEPDGYTTQIYDITEYLNFEGENLLCVRVDASLEQGWFYEGAGIYRHVWLNKVSPVSVAPFGTFIHYEFPDSTFRGNVELHMQTTVQNKGNVAADYYLIHRLFDNDGNEVGRQKENAGKLLPQEKRSSKMVMLLNEPQLWDLENPYMYNMRTDVYVGGTIVDTYNTSTGIRHIEFDSNRGFILNGNPVKIKGANMHQDHAGVGTAIPDALNVYRLKRLKALGCNAYRASHNPMTPEVLDACDKLGILVIEESRLMGVNEEHIRLLNRMIERDRNHPSIILWSVGNEEWGIEWSAAGTQIAETLREYCHRIDPSRLMTVATSGGPSTIQPVDVAGYNYILQNPVDRNRKEFPNRCALGSEETSGCGTRGIYFKGQESRGWMVSLNRSTHGPDSLLNCIERGWKFYDERPWLGGLFYWTGFDYRGEPNPLGFPATGSQFGILDYCGFPKDEAFYLKAWWTNEPVLHLFPHWNLDGHEGEKISLWAYTNCDEVELFVNGKKMGRKQVPHNGYVSWDVVYYPGRVKAVGYKDGRCNLVQTMETAGQLDEFVLEADRSVIDADNGDVSVVNIKLLDRKGNFIPNACDELMLAIEGPVRILGVGNGNPAWQYEERPKDPMARTFKVKAFNGYAQVLLQSLHEAGTGTLTVKSGGVAKTLKIQTVDKQDNDKR